MLGAFLSMCRPDIDFVGSATSTAASTAGTTASLTSLTGGSDTEARDGDMVVLGVAVAQDDNRAITVPAGYTEVDSVHGEQAAADVNILLAYKIMGGTPDTGVTVAGVSGSTGGAMCVAVMVLRGAESFAATTSSATAGGASSPTFADLSVTDGRGLLIGLAGSHHVEGTMTYSITSTGGADEWTKIVQASFEGASFDGMVALVSQDATFPATYDPTSLSVSGFSGGGQAYASIAALAKREI